MVDEKVWALLTPEEVLHIGRQRAACVPCDAKGHHMGGICPRSGDLGVYAGGDQAAYIGTRLDREALDRVETRPA